MRTRIAMIVAVLAALVFAGAALTGAQDTPEWVWVQFEIDPENGWADTCGVLATHGFNNRQGCLNNVEAQALAIPPGTLQGLHAQGKARKDGENLYSILLAQPVDWHLRCLIDSGFELPNSCGVEAPTATATYTATIKGTQQAPTITPTPEVWNGTWKMKYECMGKARPSCSVTIVFDPAIPYSLSARVCLPRTRFADGKWHFIQLAGGAHGWSADRNLYGPIYLEFVHPQGHIVEVYFDWELIPGYGDPDYDDPDPNCDPGSELMYQPPIPGLLEVNEVIY